jgi:hypothetical protein
VVELEEQELTVLRVVIVVGAPPLPIPALVSIGTTLMPVFVPHSPQLPLGEYAVTFVACTRIPIELDGRQASGASVGVAAGVPVGLGVNVAMGVVVRVGVSVRGGVGLALGDGIWLTVAEGVGVAVEVAGGVAVEVDVETAVGLEVGPRVGTVVGVGVGGLLNIRNPESSESQPATPTINRAISKHLNCEVLRMNVGFFIGPSGYWATKRSCRWDSHDLRY